MPKDWKSHRAELERLYIKEGKPLQQVRDILREEHGFNASIRAYRMRIDSWGLRKNKSIRGNQQSRRGSSDIEIGANQVVSQSISEGNQTSEMEQSASWEHLRTGQPLPLKQRPFDVMSAFETLLTKWQPRAESALLCFQHPDFNEWVKRSNPEHGPILFKLIEELVPPEEQFILNKAFLEADLLCHGDIDYPYKAWRYAWNTLLRCDDPEEDDDDEYEITYCSEDWEHVKEFLREDEVVSQVAGEKFLDCALVVLAERRLTACKNDPHHWNRRKYLDILQDFRHLEADVDPSFYKGSLQIIELEEMENAQQSKRKRADLADEYRHKYLQLVNRYAYMRRSASQVTAATGDIGTRFQQGNDDMLANDHPASTSPFLAIDQYPSPETTISAPSTSEPPDILPSSSLDIASPVFPTTQVVFETLVNKWKTLNDFTEYAHSILPNDGWAISIFEPSPAGATNLFDIISTDLPSPERIPLISALLVAFSSLSPTAFYSPWSLHWWTSIYSSPTWEKFLSRLDIPRTTSHLERIMTPAAAKLFVDAAMLLVGERLLLGIKTRLVNAKRRRNGLGDPEERARGKRLEWQYMAILREFYAREMKVDQTWTYYLMNIL